jgi:uncharacterized protein (TIGR02145 family)
MKHLSKIHFMAALMAAAILFAGHSAPAQHFDFPGGSFVGNVWTLYIGGATLNGDDLGAGDEIAIYDGNNMVGAFTLTQVCTPDNQFSNILVAYTSLLGGAPGYVPGNAVTFKCWHEATGVEAVLWQAEWQNPYGDAWTQNVFPPGSDSYSLPLLEFTFIYTGTLSGTVTDADNAQPVAGAFVQVAGTDFNATTLEDGSYQIDEIPVGTYSMEVTAEGYFGQAVQNVTITFGQTTHVNFALTKILATLQGAVTDQDGQPLEGVKVRIEGENFSVFTAADGAYSFAQIPEDVYNVTFTKSGYFAQTAENIALNNQQTTGLDVVLISATIQTITLKQGYSFISSIVLPNEPDMTQVLQDALENLSFVRNQNGQTLKKIGPNWINGIGDWKRAEGYLVKMNQPDEVTINGYGNETYPIPLKAGFNILAYLLRGPKNALEVFEPVLENLVFVRSSSGQTLTRFGQSWINTIGLMQPGEGYLVRMAGNDTLIFREFQCGDMLVDERDGNAYATVQIGDQCWMAENLAYLPQVSPSSQGSNSDPYYYVYGYEGTDVNAAKATDNYNHYGVLYNWPASLSACPEGWHLPTDTEWTVLTGYLGGESVAGGKMKSTRTAPEPHPRWNSPNTGATNSSGFSALPGGGRSTGGSFDDAGHHGYWWSSSEFAGSNAWYRHLSYVYAQVGRYGYNKSLGFSVRCLKDN